MMEFHGCGCINTAGVVTILHVFRRIWGDRTSGFTGNSKQVRHVRILWIGRRHPPLPPRGLSAFRSWKIPCHEHGS